MSTLPPSQGVTARAARRMVGRDGRLRRGIERRFARRRARRGLILVWSAVLLAAAVFPLAARLQDVLGPALVIDGLGVKLLADPFPLFLVSGALGLLIRTTVRGEADLPDEDIDERQVARRDRSHLVAYRIASTTVISVLLTAYIVSDATATQVVSANVADWLASDLFFSLIALLTFLPSAVLAWYSDDEPQDDGAEAAG